MYPLYYAIIVLVCIIASIGTIQVAREMSKREKDENSPEADLTSLKQERPVKDSSVRLLTWIYTITFIITILLIWIFIF
ncbi:hypothetical protein GCM10010954_25140 [Halobacillus andaensis]|uniref:Uncharacterized protein n=1 Tax=Halobacillus andaensis TaxID=1176239 RepID=A0A917B5J9_HALAA|nr:hypothetical protein [Halobacillus andaensis]MBP2005899.1 cell division septal protein FtsQ [Halobacillus andaensis]GGF25233.1 hypothetical protein GCM10010954_25140 [Halobacillus andaensis]